ncbi:RNA methyltransferase [Marispirochaeta aestuarii]|uniref:RNA methyltransferase n=1 Tax=Marispirochaeta aestuarii TaxID=1963862 RepID=UPI0029C692A7|nr:RNA methyltransferase [Marispirochaeta aestuarii]
MKLLEHPERQMQIVLVRPEGDANIGAVCRAMKTMGFTSLVLVLPDGREPDKEIVRTWSLSAYDVFEEASLYASLADALADSSFSVGFTRRTGSRRRTRFYDLEEIAPGIIRRVLESGELISLVFGNEQSGLDSEELALCSAAASIESHFAFPSLNLSHAVQIVCYSLRRALMGAASGTPGDPGITRREAETVAENITEELRTIGFFTLGDSTWLRNFFRDLVERAGLNSRESEYLKSLFEKIRNLKLHRPE